jgi:hypothetical protein
MDLPGPVGVPTVEIVMNGYGQFRALPTWLKLSDFARVERLVQAG